MAYEVGDWQIPTLTVSPYDGTTSATLEVVSPSGVTTTPAVTASGGGTTWTGAGYELTAAGEWVERWTVTGMGKSAERRILLVAPDPTTGPSGQRVYATTTDYANALRKAPPANSRRALAAASTVVDEMLLTAVYDVDTDGMPTKASVIQALRDATCAQAEHAKLTGDDNGTGVTGGGISQFSIGSVNVTRGNPAASTTTAALPPHWSPAAWRFLSAEGLTNQPPWSQ